MGHKQNVVIGIGHLKGPAWPPYTMKRMATIVLRFGHVRLPTSLAIRLRLLRQTFPRYSVDHVVTSKPRVIRRLITNCKPRSALGKPD